MSDLFNFVAANWRWLMAAAIALTYLVKGVVIVKQWERVPVTRWVVMSAP